MDISWNGILPGKGHQGGDLRLKRESRKTVFHNGGNNNRKGEKRKMQQKKWTPVLPKRLTSGRTFWGKKIDQGMTATNRREFKRQSPWPSDR